MTYLAYLDKKMSTMHDKGARLLKEFGLAACFERSLHNVGLFDNLALYTIERDVLNEPYVAWIEATFAYWEEFSADVGAQIASRLVERQLRALMRDLGEDE